MCESVKEYVMISACLLGTCCKYDGGHNQLDQEMLEKLMERVHLIPVCPEQLGGLATPRQPAEVQGEKVITKDDRDVTEQFERGAREALKLTQLFGCGQAILKGCSPSCGSGEIYDGTFSKTRVPGDGKTAGLLKQQGIVVYTELDLQALFLK